MALDKRLDYFEQGKELAFLNGLHSSQWQQGQTLNNSSSHTKHEIDNTFSTHYN